jgi:GTP pyrophosphokinase
MSTGRGIVVHRDDCKNLAEFEDNPEKFLPVNWSQNVEGEFLVELHLELENKRGIVAILASKIADQHSNIEKISLEERDAKVSIAHVLLYVTSRVHLANIMRRLKTVKAVTKITRAKN